MKLSNTSCTRRSKVGGDDELDARLLGSSEQPFLSEGHFTADDANQDVYACEHGLELFHT